MPQLRCPYCRYIWEPLAKTTTRGGPKACPRCGRRLDGKRKAERVEVKQET